MILNAFWALFAGGKYESPLNLVSLNGLVSACCLGYIRNRKFVQQNVFLGHADSH